MLIHKGVVSVKLAMISTDEALRVVCNGVMLQSTSVIPSPEPLTELIVATAPSLSSFTPDDGRELPDLLSVSDKSPSKAGLLIPLLLESKLTSLELISECLLLLTISGDGVGDSYTGFSTLEYFCPFFVLSLSLSSNAGLIIPPDVYILLGHVVPLFSSGCMVATPLLVTCSSWEILVILLALRLSVCKNNQ